MQIEFVTYRLVYNQIIIGTEKQLIDLKAFKRPIQIPLAFGLHKFGTLCGVYSD